MELTKILSNNYVFRGLPAPAVNVLAAYATVRSHRGGDVLVRQFDRSDDLIILTRGEAITTNFIGEEIARFGPGSAIGEIALLDGSPRSATIVAVGDGDAAHIPAECVRGLMEADSRFESRILRNLALVLCRRLRSMNDRAGVGHAA